MSDNVQPKNLLLVLNTELNKWLLVQKCRSSITISKVCADFTSLLIFKVANDYCERATSKFSTATA